MTRSFRYHVHERLPEVGRSGQERLSAAHVAVVGAGGLGSSVLLQLISLGLGTLTIVDDDTVAWDNLQRQFLYTEADVGRYKAVVAREHLMARNSDVNVRAHRLRLTPGSAEEILAGADVLIDCTDNLEARLAIDDYCHTAQIPLVYGGVKGFAAQVAVFHYRGGPSFRDTFPDVEALRHLPTCTDSGVLAPVVALTAALQVSEAVKIILELPGVLTGKLQAVQLLTNSFRTLHTGPLPLQSSAVS